MASKYENMADYEWSDSTFDIKQPPVLWSKNVYQSHLRPDIDRHNPFFIDIFKRIEFSISHNEMLIFSNTINKIQTEENDAKYQIAKKIHHGLEPIKVKDRNVLLIDLISRECGQKPIVDSNTILFRVPSIENRLKKITEY